MKRIKYLKFILLAALLFLHPISCYAATECIAVIDPDNAHASVDYTTLDAWEDDLGASSTPAVTSGDLPNDDEIAVAQCVATSGGNDSSAVDVTGWTTDATRYIRIELHSDETNTGKWNDSNYILEGTDGIVLQNREDYVTIKDVQILCNITADNNGYGISIVATGTTSGIIIDSCLIKGSCAGTGYGGGINCADADATVQVYNSIIYDFVSGSDTGFVGFYSNGGGSFNVYNTTVHNCGLGMRDNTNSGTHIVKNCAVFDNLDDFSNFDTPDYCASDDGDGNNSVSPSGGDWANEMPDYATDDFSLTNTGNLYEGGTDDPSSGAYSDDIAGLTRTSTWDIGAFEYDDSEAPAPPAVTAETAEGKQGIARGIRQGISRGFR